ncbi:MAG: 6-O-methylguanine DNA methyltransferase [Monoraphidium minutum]|nr:MAG: 6-O-methylguanine DNA methyltransferase [Monoraphidium minutum]
MGKAEQRAPTPYEERVYKMCSAIPKGKVSTYGEMAKALASSARAVGQAMRRNPFAPRVPCHRVIAADLQLGGFSGSWGAECANVQRKRQMLLDEGVAIDGGRVARRCVVRAPELAALVAAAK